MDDTIAILNGIAAAEHNKATALAEKITKKAEDALSGLDREMVIMKWPHEFREIMWGAVVVVASRLRSESAAAADRDGRKPG